jgi:hypothetical protein
LKKIFQQDNWVEFLFAILVLEDTVSTRESARQHRVAEEKAKLQELMETQQPLQQPALQQPPSQAITNSALMLMFAQYLQPPSTTAHLDLSAVPRNPALQQNPVPPQNPAPQQTPVPPQNLAPQRNPALQQNSASLLSREQQSTLQQLRKEQDFNFSISPANKENVPNQFSRRKK